jgi:hypothetical protein
MFEYLGPLVINTNEVEIEIKTRIIASNECYHVLGHFLKKKMYNTLRVGLCKRVIRPIVTCGAELCTLMDNGHGDWDWC